MEIGGKVEQLSQKETLKFHLREYIEWGGFPEIVLEKDNEMKKELLRFYSDSILYRDVVNRSGITKVERLEMLKNLLLTNVSNPMNYNKLARLLGISADTVTSYIHAMESAYYIFPVSVHSYSLKKQQINPKKIYCIDNGLRNSVGFKFSSDVGRLYENTVFLQLKRLNDGIFYWKVGNVRNGSGAGEVDFLVKEGNHVKKAIQVCYDMDTAGDREMKSLLLALNEFDLEEGTVITGNNREVKEFGDKRIRCVPLWEWLLQQ